MRPWQSASPVPSAPLPKGGWHGEAVTGGFLPASHLLVTLFVGAGFYPAYGRGRAPPLRTAKKPTALLENVSLQSRCAHRLRQSVPLKSHTFPYITRSHLSIPLYSYLFLSAGRPKVRSNSVWLLSTSVRQPSGSRCHTRPSSRYSASASARSMSRSP